MAKTYHRPTLLDHIRTRYFATRLDTAMSVIFGAVTLWILWSLLNWAVLDAVFSAADKEHCGHDAGACWSVIDARWRLILFGLYPFEEQWRSAIACASSSSVIPQASFWMLSVVMLAIFNASFGIYFPKFVGTIFEVLSAPISPFEIVPGYVGAAA